LSTFEAGGNVLSLALSKRITVVLFLQGLKGKKKESEKKKEHMSSCEAGDHIFVKKQDLFMFFCELCAFFNHPLLTNGL